MLVNTALLFTGLAAAVLREVEWNVTYVENISPDGSGVARRVIGYDPRPT